MQNNVKESNESTCQQYRSAWHSVWLKLGLSLIQNDEFYQNWFGSELGYFWLTIISGINILNSIPHQSYGNKKRPSPIIYEVSKHWMQQIPTCQWSIIRVVIVTHLGAETRQFCLPRRGVGGNGPWISRSVVPLLHFVDASRGLPKKYHSGKATRIVLGLKFVFLNIWL